MGEEPWRVHMVGDPALDHFVRGSQASAEELTAALGFLPDRRTLLVTFHPATREAADMPRQAAELASALAAYDGPLVITAPVPDPGGDPIRRELQRLVDGRKQAVFAESLGSRRYRGVMRLVGAMVGNSSSGLIEAFCVPLAAVNIGSRQQGRDPRRQRDRRGPATSGHSRGNRPALSGEFRAALAGVRSPYGDGLAAGRVVNKLAQFALDERLPRKRFVNLQPQGLD